MLFRRKPIPETNNPNGSPSDNESLASQAPSMQSRTSTAHTAHLVGPGCMKLEADMPIWKPVDAPAVKLHPEYLKAIVCYGNVDFSTAVLCKLWHQGTQVVFLSPGGHRLLGRLQPQGNYPNLPRLQHLAAADPKQCLSIAKTIVTDKLNSTIKSIRYYQQQGKGIDASPLMTNLKSLTHQAQKVSRVDALRGIEGTAAKGWFEFFRSLLPPEWSFPSRISHPPTDPINALLSLGYTLALSRCQQLIAAADLDPLVGFLHELRSGRPSLACDVMEPLRVPLIDRWILSLLVRKQLTADSFEQDQQAIRLKPSQFKEFIGGFEKQFLAMNGAEPSFRDQTQTRIDGIATSLREA